MRRFHVPPVVETRTAGPRAEEVNKVLTDARAGGSIEAAQVAVLPFRAAGIHPDLAYLGEGMVDLLATKLTGESGGLRALPPGLAWYTVRVTPRKAHRIGSHEMLPYTVDRESTSRSCGLSTSRGLVSGMRPEPQRSSRTLTRIKSVNYCCMS
jgi:hypothetical protein